MKTMDRSYGRRPKDLAPIFKALSLVKEQLGKEIYEEIRYRLVDGTMGRDEAEYLQNLRRNNMAKHLGMTRKKYEASL